MVYDKPMLSLEQAQAAVSAMIADYTYNDEPNRRKVDMVLDDAGLVYTGIE